MIFLQKYAGFACFVLALAAFLLPVGSARAATVASDGKVDRDDPDFVRASLLVMTPGSELFSCVGHAAIRLECPTFKLDYCFSYESERAVDRLPSFLVGKLKMGMFALKTEEFLTEYRKEGRGVRQYALNLPPKVKQRLWKQMDDLVAQGANLPYDYMKRGCAKSVLDCLKVACAPLEMSGPMLPITQRETFHCELRETHPWNLFFLNALVGTETDTFTEVVTPKNLLNYLRQARVNGVPPVTGEGREVLPQTLKFSSSWISPQVIVWGILALTGMLWIRGGGLLAVAKKGMVGLLLSVQALVGCFFVFLVTASHLPNSAWNWLLVPFNPVMPVVAGARARWGRVMAGASVLALVGWSAFMLGAEHARTDPAYVVLALAYAVVYLKRAVPRKMVAKS